MSGLRAFDLPGGFSSRGPTARLVPQHLDVVAVQRFLSARIRAAGRYVSLRRSTARRHGTSRL